MGATGKTIGNVATRAVGTFVGGYFDNPVLGYQIGAMAGNTAFGTPIKRTLKRKTNVADPNKYTAYTENPGDINYSTNVQKEEHMTDFVKFGKGLDAVVSTLGSLGVSGSSASGAVKGALGAGTNASSIGSGMSSAEGAASAALGTGAKVASKGSQILGGVKAVSTGIGAANDAFNNSGSSVETVQEVQPREPQGFDQFATTMQPGTVNPIQQVNRNEMMDFNEITGYLQNQEREMTRKGLGFDEFSKSYKFKPNEFNFDTNLGRSKMDAGISY